MIDLPSTPWQPTTAGMRPCPHHYGLCAYYAGDPTRCDRCHRSWALILADEPESAHDAWHDARDAQREADKARMRAVRATTRHVDAKVVSQ